MTLKIRPDVDDGEEYVVLGIEQGGFTLREHMTPDHADELAEDLKDIAENVREMRAMGGSEADR